MQKMQFKIILNYFGVIFFSCITKYFLFVLNTRLIYEKQSILLLFLYNFIAIASALLIADFLSGMLHWTLDSYGSENTFLLGPLIENFRYHHENEQFILKRNFAEKNWDSMLFCASILLFMYVTKMFSAERNTLFCLLQLYVLLFSGITNEVHCAAHRTKNNLIIDKLQYYNILISKEKHGYHHENDQTTTYCILTGWNNWWMEKIQWWRKLEFIVEKITFVKARAYRLQN